MAILRSDQRVGERPLGFSNILCVRLKVTGFSGKQEGSVDDLFNPFLCHMDGVVFQCG